MHFAFSILVTIPLYHCAHAPVHLGTIESFDSLSFSQVSCHYSSVAFNLSMLCSQSSIKVWLQMLHNPLSSDCQFSLFKADMVPYHSSLSSHLLWYTICTATSLLFRPGFSYCLSPGSFQREDLCVMGSGFFDKSACLLRMGFIIALFSQHAELI